jgi:hypothetical protein
MAGDSFALRSGRFDLRILLTVCGSRYELELIANASLRLLGPLRLPQLKDKVRNP